MLERLFLRQKEVMDWQFDVGGGVGKTRTPGKVPHYLAPEPPGKGFRGMGGIQEV
jgi:hypothetical protein